MRIKSIMFDLFNFTHNLSIVYSGGAVYEENRAQDLQHEIQGPAGHYRFFMVS